MDSIIKSITLPSGTVFRFIDKRVLDDAMKKAIEKQEKEGWGGLTYGR